MDHQWSTHTGPPLSKLRHFEKAPLLTHASVTNFRIELLDLASGQHMLDRITHCSRLEPSQR